VTGRAKDLIIRGGHNIDPVLIEEPLSRHPAVAETAAIGMPDPYAGEVPVVYVRLKKNVPGVDEAELMSWCREHISEQAALPKRINILDVMPVTAAGKIFKPDLINHATEIVLGEYLGGVGLSAQIEARFDPQRGRIAKVTPADPQDNEKILEVLNKFPLVIEVTQDA